MGVQDEGLCRNRDGGRALGKKWESNWNVRKVACGRHTLPEVGSSDFLWFRCFSMRSKMKRVLVSLKVTVDGQWVKYFVILWMALSFGYDVRSTVYFSLLWEVVVKKPVLLSLDLWPTAASLIQASTPFLLDCCCGLLTVPCCHSSASYWVTSSSWEPPESQSRPRTP